jgi:predicted nucleic acid-binding protein
MTRIFIDTEIWSFGLKKPEENDSEEMKNRFTIAHNFLMERIKNDEIFISTHQIAEIFHVLSFRGKKLPIEFSSSFIEKLTQMSNISIIPITKNHIKQAFSLCNDSGIHIWDFLCIIPITNNIEIIYTCDKHMKSKIFQNFKIPIQNPIDIWLNL